jgi:hypothetical protein
MSRASSERKQKGEEEGRGSRGEKEEETYVTVVDVLRGVGIGEPSSGGLGTGHDGREEGCSDGDCRDVVEDGDREMPGALDKTQGRLVRFEDGWAKIMGRKSGGKGNEHVSSVTDRVVS